jgi:hypothetical protein
VPHTTTTTTTTTTHHTPHTTTTQQEGGEVDLEAADQPKPHKAGGGATGPDKPAKRQRFERYDDDFIDDSELEMARGGPAVKTKYRGFFVNQVCWRRGD